MSPTNHKILLILSFCLLINVVKSQNLVQNYSFENAWSCPDDYVGYTVKKPFPNWLNPNNGTPDIMHSCSALRAGIPDNFAGSMYPYDGNAYVGIILKETFDDSLKVYKGVSREYLQTKLSEPLKKDKLYCVKFYYVNAKKSMFSVDALGVTLTIDKIYAKNADRIIQHPQITNKPGHIMSEMDNWIEFCGYYRARGNEQYLTIGNFWDNKSTKYIKNDNEYSDSSFFYAYYLIDNVFVFEIESEFECGCLNDFTLSSDWKSDNFDPATGYNTRKNSQDLISENNDNNTNRDNENAENFENVENNKSEITREAFENAKIGDRFRLDRIYFEFNSAELLTISFVQLDSLTSILNNKPNIRIEIRGHTDNIGTEKYNKTLSMNRAAAVYNYLLAKGITKSRMKYRGFGDNVPFTENDTEEGRELNRRVEILIMEL